MILFVIPIGTAFSQTGVPDIIKDYDYSMIVNQVDSASIMQHVEYLSSLGSRVRGYSGCYLAEDYIYDKFEEYGLVNLTKQSFTTVTFASFLSFSSLFLSSAPADIILLS